MVLNVFPCLFDHLPTGRGQVTALALPYGVAQDEEGDQSQCRYPVDADPEGKGEVERLVAQCDDEAGAILLCQQSPKSEGSLNFNTSTHVEMLTRNSSGVKAREDDS